MCVCIAYALYDTHTRTHTHTHTQGFIHCDPHEGNLIALPNGKVALIDFGLFYRMSLTIECVLLL